MEELRRRLQDVVARRYEGKARPASMDAGLNPNAVGNLLGGATKVPDLWTLEKLAAAFDWRLEDVVYWALDRTAPTEPDPLVAIAQHLARCGLSEDARQTVLRVVRQFLG